MTGLTHDERGYPCATNPKLHAALVKRLVDKIENARDEMADYDIINPDAEQVFVAYGAPVRTVQQVLHDRTGREYRVPPDPDGLAVPREGPREVQKCPSVSSSRR